MSQEKEIRTNSTLIKCDIKLPGYYGAELSLAVL